MQNTDNRIYFNFSYYALKLLGKGLYSNNWTAIAELVANGIDAQATSVKIYINMIDKKHSSIEIFDNGYGMGYDDIAEKYVLIGKDKREDESISDEVKKQLMGRKGIGKLAALFMSNKYFLISKTKKTSEEAWCLDATNVQDSDVPRLDKVSLEEVGIEAKEEWAKFSTGTMIKLTNVDFTNIGIQTIEGLKARLADFYLLKGLKSDIQVAMVGNRKDEIKFSNVQKSIAFKNFYAFYDNTDYKFKDDLAKSVRVMSDVASSNNKARDVVLLNLDDFDVKGKKIFTRENGKAIEKEYNMSGWIGIHTSISKEGARRNDKEFLRNKAYRPNFLRLYVRKKLAVENFLEYIKNTQAFSNYIEGEVQFDILDDNDLGDISTSNRQGFIEDDERVKLLVEILSPIINRLIRLRVKLGSQVKEEETKHYEELERIEKEKREKEEKQRIAAEQKQQEAMAAKAEAEGKQREAESQAKKLSVNLGSEKKRNSFLLDNLEMDQIEFAKRLHMFNINISIMNSLIKKQVMKLQRNRYNVDDAWEVLRKMSYYTARMQAILKYSPAAVFDPKEEFVKGDLFEFIDEYAKTIICKGNDINMDISIIGKDRCEMRFAPQDISVILENVLSNSLKHNAKNIYIDMYKENGEAIIDLRDDGDGIADEVSDVNELFEFGKSYTSTGTGVGLYNIKQIVEEIWKGTVEIVNNGAKGFCLQIRI